MSKVLEAQQLRLRWRLHLWPKGASKRSDRKRSEGTASARIFGLGQQMWVWVKALYPW